jgi:hypothetical protein
MKKYSIRKKNNLRKKSKKHYSKKKINYNKKYSRKNKSKNRRQKTRRRGLKGGSCGCNTYPLSGGNGNNLGPVGYAWKGGNVNTWPGVKGVDSMSNHFPLSKYGVTPGGVDPLYGSSVQKGGFLQDLVNLGRYGQYDGQSIVNGFMGVKAPVNPLPYNDQPIDKDMKIITSNVPDLTKYYVDANNYAGKL